jgi:hypothetical protein
VLDIRINMIGYIFGVGHECYIIGYTHYWLVVWNMTFFSIQLGMSSSQLTKSHIFQRGRYTTNQITLISDIYINPD